MMTTGKRLTLPLITLALALLGTGLEHAVAQAVDVLPYSDKENTGGWVLNTDVSDEFETSTLDEEKWFIQGTNGGFHKWKGRAPSQFAPHNVRVEDGKLKLRSQWEPEYEFSGKIFDGRNYENITTAGVVGQRKFLYGYMEIKSKAGDAAMTSSFWTLGYQSELDMFEQMGKPSLPEKKQFANSYMFSIHDWRPGVVAGKNKIFTQTHQLDYRVADDFHVYGCEWGENYLKFYEDGKLVYSTTQKELGDKWILTNPLELWFDSETFPWMGLPAEEDLPVDFEIEYVRVWQKPHPNLLDRAFFGFEGPILVDEVRLPAKEEEFRKLWYIDDNSKPNLSIADDKFFLGRKSLKFTSDDALAKDQVVAFSPGGSVDLPANQYALWMKVWVEPESTVERVHFILEDPWLELPPIELKNLPRGEWVTVSQRFSRDSASSAKDRLRVVVKQADVPAGKTTFYIDELTITAPSRPLPVTPKKTVPNPPAATPKASGINPASDPSNSGKWKLNKEVSDEFNAMKLDEKKWLIQGKDGVFKSRWIGRAPSQFSTDNVRVEDGKLKIQTRWEPDFDFSDKPGKDGEAYENITTAAVIGKNQFHYGYMEIRCKAADASITSSFWMTGEKSELDVFEFVGASSLKHKRHLDKEMMFTMINWGKPPGPDRRSWRGKHELDWNIADDFHTYGCEWNEDYLKFFADGEQVGEVTREELGERWILTNPLWIWVDSETFSWVGLPSKKDLPVDFEIDYIRVWQQ